MEDPEMHLDRRRMAGSRVLLFGAGMLGSSVLEQLCGEGFRHIVVADPENGAEEREGVTYLKRDAKSVEGWNYDVIVSCLEDMRSRLLVNSRAKEYLIPLVDGSVSEGRGRIQTVLRTGPCVACGLNRRHPNSVRRAKVPEEDSELVRRMASVMAAEVCRIASGRTDLCLKGVMYCESDGASAVIPMEVDRRCPHHASGDRRRQGPAGGPGCPSEGI